MNLRSELIEVVASVIHEAWMSWSQELARKEPISPPRVSRWKTQWKPYRQLPDESKERYRAWARRALGRIRQLSEELEA